MCHCGAVVKVLLARADNPVRLPATRFSVSLYQFFVFLFGLFFLTLFFPFGLFFFILIADPAGHALGSIYILSLSVEFYFGKGISKPLDLHTGQAYDQKKKQKKHELSRHVPPLEQLIFFSMLVGIMTNNTQYTANCTNLQPTPTSDPLAKFKLIIITLNSPLGLPQKQNNNN